MNVTCSAEPCPVILNATCVFYEGTTLLYTGITTNDNLQVALQKIDAKFADASIGYAFNNGLIQSAPGQPVQLGGSLIQNTTIGGNYKLAFVGELEASALVTTGGTSSQFVKGDGTLDSTSYQPAGNYITSLVGDGTASGPGAATLTLATVFGAPGTYGNSTTVPRVTVDSKGRVTNVVNTLIALPSDALLFQGDVTGSGFTGSPVTLTLNTVNADIYGSNNFLKFAVNGKGLITSATPVSGGDITTALGYVPVDDAIQLTINGVSHDLSANRSWSVGTVTTVGVTAGTGISASVSNPTTNPTISITNTAPDQIVVLNGGTGISISGSYPNFTVTNDYPSLGGTVTSFSAGNLSPLFTTSVSNSSTTPALSFALSNAAANTVFAGPNGGSGAPTFRALVAADIPSLSYISSISVAAPLATTGGLIPTLSISKANSTTNGYLSSTDWNTFNNKTSCTGTVTNVAVCSSTIGVSVSGSPITTSGTIGVDISTASSVCNGLLSSIDWNTFNNKQDSLGYTPVPDSRELTINGVAYDLTSDRTWSVGTVTSVGTSGPLTGGTITNSGTIGITQAGSGSDGYLSSADWSTFNGKQPAGSYITDLTGDGTASGPGSACLTLASVNLTTGTFGSSTQVPVITVNGKGLVTCVTTSNISGSLEFIGDVTGVGSTGTCTTLTLATVNNDVYASETLLNIAVNGKGLITSANPTTSGDICSTLGYTPEDVANKSTSTSLGTSNTLYPTQLAVKTYVDSATAGGIILQGNWDASTNTPNISGTTTTGWAWRVDVAGTTNLGGITDWQVGDLAVKSATGWVKIDNTENVTSVFGRYGSIVATTGDYLTCQVTECGDLYYTDARVRAAVGHTAPLTYNSGTGVFGITQSNSTTDGYLSATDWNTFNDKQPLIVAGTTSQYYRGDKTFQTLDTSVVTEGTNLYFTDARARAAICASSGVAYNPTTGQITNSCPDQIVSLTGGGTTSVTGTYPNFTISSSDCFTGTVTCVAVTGTNIGVTGSPITSAGTVNLSLSGANVCSALGYTPYNSTNPAGYTTCVGTVTNVASCTSTTGVLLSGSPVTTSGTLGIDISTASATCTGLLTSADWNTFNSKTSCLGTVTSVAASTSTTGVSITGSPITGSGTLGINVSTASSVCTGLLTSADWNTFNSKTSCLGTVTSVGLTSATTGVTIGSSPITSSGNITLAIATASATCTGLLTSADWSNFNSHTACTGTVTSVDATGTNITVTGGPITTSGTLAISLSGANVCSALGYTPYNSSNPAGYTTCTGTVTSVGIVATNINVCNSPVTTSGNICLNLTAANVCAALGYSPSTAPTIFVNGIGTCSVLRCGVSNSASGDYAASLGGKSNLVSGCYSTIVGGQSNNITERRAVIVGGLCNTVSSYGGAVFTGVCNTSCGISASVVLGGSYNTASGYLSITGGGNRNTSSGTYSSVFGGKCNTASGGCSTVSGGYLNTASNTYASVGGGARNTASALSSNVAGGRNNIASASCSSVGGGFCNIVCGAAAFIGGGVQNKATGSASVVAGGTCNLASNSRAAIGGGFCNTASAQYSFVGGGCCNLACGTFSFVGSGKKNTASTACSTISGGYCNTVSGILSSVVGGQCNNVSGACSFVGGGYLNCSYLANFATIGGGSRHFLSGNYSTISGGYTNCATFPYTTIGGGFGNTASSFYGFIGGGCGNRLTTSGYFGSSVISGGQGNCGNGDYLFIGGGQCNTISGSYLVGASIVGGNCNASSNCYSFVGGGLSNTASGINSFVGAGQSNISSNSYATVVGGQSNCATNTYAFVGGGQLNVASGDKSTIGGGSNNISSSNKSTVGGGCSNTASSLYTVVAGGYYNRAEGIGATVGGGKCNVAQSDSSTVSGGYGNTAATSCLATISGGCGNTASGYGSYVAGGKCNIANQPYAGVFGCGLCNANACTFMSHNFVIGDFVGCNGCSLALDINGKICIGSGAVAVMVAGTGICSILGNGCGNTAGGCQSFAGGGGFNTASGYRSFIGGGGINNATCNYSTVTGGIVNNAYANYAFVGGGFGNTASGAKTSVVGGNSNTASGYYAFVGGGSSNTTTSYQSFIGAGYNNYITSGNNSAIVGGINNTVSSYYSFIGGGVNNTVNGNRSAVLGGYCNTASGTYSGVFGCGLTNSVSCSFMANRLIAQNLATAGCAVCTDANGMLVPYTASAGAPTLYIVGVGYCSTIRCGVSNTASANYSAALGGKCNIACGQYSYVGGGANNTASSYYTVVSGGQGNTASANRATVSGGFANTSSGQYSFVGGGQSNTAQGVHSIVAGGRSNSVVAACSAILSGCCSVVQSNFSVIGGGQAHGLYALNSFIGGGNCNYIYNFTSPCLSYGSVVVGGVGNNTTGGTWTQSSCAFTVAPSLCVPGSMSFIGGGFQNSATGACSAVLGGQQNTASGAFSGAFGCGLTASAACTFYVNNLCTTGIINATTCVSSATVCGTTSLVSPSVCATGLTTGCAVCVGASGLLTSYTPGGGGIVIAGSGTNSTIRCGISNSALGIGSVALGGCFNSAGGDCSFIGGGCFNNTACGFSTVSGGASNNACALGATVAGGRQNKACSTGAFVGGGGTSFSGNTASGTYSVVVGGACCNVAAGSCSFVGGGLQNCACGSADAIVAGWQNLGCSSNSAFIGNGFCNFICSAFCSSIENGNCNFICSSSASSIINGACQRITAFGQYNTIVNGVNNISCGSYGFIGNGCSCNTGASGNANTICCNSTLGTILNGTFNRISGPFATNTCNSTILGGVNNCTGGNFNLTFGQGNNVNCNFTGAIGCGNSTTVDHSYVIGCFLTNSCCNSLLANCLRAANLITNGIVYSNTCTLTNTNPSDRTLKCNITASTYGLCELKQLNPVKYKWICGDGSCNLGFIAQEVKEVLPSFVGKNDDNTLGLYSDRFTPLTVKAVQELNDKLDAQEQRLAVLEDIIKRNNLI